MTNTLTTLQSLRDRVANATGHDRDIDAALCEAFCLYPAGTERVMNTDGASTAWAGNAIWWEALPLTSSIDAALAWVERVLPNSTGNMISWQQRDVGKPRWCGYWVKIVPDGERSGGAREAYAPSIALAIILSGLDALIAKERTR